MKNIVKNKILVVFANGESRVYKNRSEAYRELGVDWAELSYLIATGKAYNPRWTKRKDVVGMTVDYAQDQI